MASELVRELCESFESIGVTSEGFGAVPLTVGQFKASILSRVSDYLSKFLADNPGLIPPRDAVLDAVDAAIHLVFTEINRPLIARLVSPPVKAWARQAVGQLYDSLFPTVMDS